MAARLTSDFVEEKIHLEIFLNNEISEEAEKITTFNVYSIAMVIPLVRISVPASLYQNKLVPAKLFSVFRHRVEQCEK